MGSIFQMLRGQRGENAIGCSAVGHVNELLPVCQPRKNCYQTAGWPNVVQLEPHELGASVSSRYMEAANRYSMMMWRRSFQSLRLNDKALALYYCDAPKETILPGPVAQEDSLQSQNLRLAIGRLNELANQGHVVY